MKFYESEEYESVYVFCCYYVKSIRLFRRKSNIDINVCCVCVIESFPFAYDEVVSRLRKRKEGDV